MSIKRKKKPSSLPNEEKKRRKREVIIIIAIIVSVTILTFIEIQVLNFGTNLPISNTILMFILININLLLLLLLLFLVFRNLVKLYYDRRRKLLGSKLRTKLVTAFITLTLLPTIVLFFFSIHFITSSIAFWFNAPVEQALENSLKIGREFYQYIENNNKFFIERISYQIKTRNLLEDQNKKELSRYIQVVQRAFNLDGVEVYNKKGQRVTFAQTQEFETQTLNPITLNDLGSSTDQNKNNSFSETVQKGELIRTISTFPFKIPANIEDIKGFIVISILISKELSQNMKSIERGFEEYQQIKLMKKPIQITYYIALSIVALLVIFCAVWFAFYLAKPITIPIMELVEGIKRVAEGDLSFNIKVIANDEIGTLVEAFNKMTQDLSIGREKLAQSQSMLKQQNKEIDEQRRYMEIILQNVSTGVVSMDSHGFITTINKSAEYMLNLKSEKILGKSYRQLLKNKYMPLALEIQEKLGSSHKRIEIPLKLTLEGRPKSFLAHFNALKNDSGEYMGMVMIFDDMTELEKAQRMLAWREVAKRIAHEVKNPLTPITLSAQRIKRKYSKELNEKIFDECIKMIIDHVELIRNLVNEFAKFARFPTANPKPCNLANIIYESVALYKEGHPKIDFSINMENDLPTLNLDRQQIKQAMINLIDNAITAIRDNGIVSIILTHDPILKSIRLEITDNGEGISDEEKTRLFEPYFSTKKTGMGLGLAIVNTIIADHNGMISVQDNQPKGAKFVVEFPI